MQAQADHIRTVGKRRGKYHSESALRAFCSIPAVGHHNFKVREPGVDLGHVQTWA